MKAISIINGGPAFPTMFRNDGDLNVSAPDGAVVPPAGEYQLLGMSLRDYFAGQALIGMLSQPADAQNVNVYDNPKHAASWSYELADAMLAQRDGRPGGA